MASRGIRNCNPGNIRRSKDKWQGLCPVQTDKAFFQFVSLEYGYRAMAKLLLNYNKKYGINTVNGFIGRWAPPSENHTPKYAAFVANRLGIDGALPIDIHDAQILTTLCAAISRYENGEEPMLGYVREGVRMALDK